MKKTLIIARHAHTHDPVPGQADHERKLTPEGLRSAHTTANWLKGKGIIPDRILASSAVRTQSTASVYADVLLNDAEKYESEDALFRIKEPEVIDFIHENLADENTVMLVGHNPTSTEVVLRFGAEELTYLPPASVVVFTFDIGNWEELNYRSGELTASYFPEEES